MLKRLRLLLQALFFRSRMEDELQEELRFHLEKEIEENIIRGMSLEKARVEALRSFGGVEWIREQCRDARGVRLIEELQQDLRYGLRMLCKAPVFTSVTVLTLALGIGANTAIFSVVNAVLLRPLPYKDPDRLMYVWQTRSPGSSGADSSPANFLDWQKQNSAFERLEAVTVEDFNLTGVDSPEPIHGMLVTNGFFSMLGLRPQLGRDFLAEEVLPGHGYVAILSYEFWQRRFGGDPGILNQTIKLHDKSYTVIGAMPPNQGLRWRDTDIWMPFTTEIIGQRNPRFRNIIGRLKAEITLEQARFEMNLMADRLAKQSPSLGTGWEFRIDPLYELAFKNLRPALLFLLAAVAFVLLIACTNVAGLLLARAAARQREIVLRVALGASRGRIIQQLLAESLLLALAGGIIGVTLAYGGLETLLSLADIFWPRVMNISLDGRMLSFTILITLLTGLGVGLVPAFQTSKPDLNRMIKDANCGSGRSMRDLTLRNILVVLEVAMSLVLLVGAGLMIRSLAHLQNVDTGYQPSGVLTASISLPEKKYPESRQQVAFYTQLIEGVRRLPGIEVAGASSNVPFNTAAWVFPEFQFKIKGRLDILASDETSAAYYSVNQDYFTAMGIHLLRGRLFSDQDLDGASRVAIINKTLAKKFFPDEEPVGKYIQIANGSESYREIIGVVGDVKHRLDQKEDWPQIYEPYTQQPFPFMTLVVRTTGDPRAYGEAIRREVLKLDRELPLSKLETLEQLVKSSTSQRRFLVLLLEFFAVVAVGLAAIGLYGVMSYAVSQRTHEIGVRMALGAQKLDVLGLVLRQGVRLTLIGTAIGLLAAWAATRLLINLLYGVGATDPLTFIGVSLLLIGIALLACYLPARRATNIDPLEALRRE